MNIGVSQINIKDGGGGDFDFTMQAREAYKTNTQDSAMPIAYEATPMIKDFANVVNQYCKKFEQDFNAYKVANNVAEKMKNSLNPGRKKEIIAVSQKEILQDNQETKNFIQTMNLGHSLLLQMRETLTGQKIRTKFMIEDQGHTYEVYEDEIQDLVGLTLSRFGGNSASNPFSLAYELDAEVLRASGILKEENRVDKLDIYKEIANLKRPYLDEKSKVTGRYYPNIYFDSKDMEIIELFQQQTDSAGYASLSLEDYTSYRQEMGGGGGYATAFYKMGDIGSIQVKFFKFKDNAKKTTVNFARFSLLRDRFRQLSQILSKPTETDVMEGLLEFFTEKEKNVTPELNAQFNEIAKREILSKWLTKS